MTTSSYETALVRLAPRHTTLRDLAAAVGCSESTASRYVDTSMLARPAGPVAVTPTAIPLVDASQGTDAFDPYADDSDNDADLLRLAALEAAAATSSNASGARDLNGHVIGSLASRRAEKHEDAVDWFEDENVAAVRISGQSRCLDCFDLDRDGEDATALSGHTTDLEDECGDCGGELGDGLPTGVADAFGF